MGDVGKLSSADKMRIEILREQGYKAKMTAEYLLNNWKLSRLRLYGEQKCQLVDQAGLTIERNAGGR